jgi:hypothetical protein
MPGSAPPGSHSQAQLADSCSRYAAAGHAPRHRTSPAKVADTKNILRAIVFGDQVVVLSLYLPDSRRLPPGSKNFLKPIVGISHYGRLSR